MKSFQQIPGAPLLLPPPHGPFELIAAALLILSALLPATGCGNKEANACVPGQSIACAGPAGCQGSQVCKSDGSGYDACTCGKPGDAGSDQSFPHVGPYSGLLGAACSKADECRHGLECILPNSRLIKGEGPSGGMCLTQCLVAHDFCSSVDATAECVTTDDRGTASTDDDLAYCLPGCKIGTQPGAADKCRGRSDLVCTESLVGSGKGYCRPACRSDIDCAPLFCDLGTGLCNDAARTGSPIGDSCDPQQPQCAGACIAQGTAFSECSGVCSYGREGCGLNSDPPLDYFCAVITAAGAGDGDLGYCAKTCDCDSDCAASSGVCEPQPDLVSKAGHKGFCAPPLGPAGKPTSHLPCAP